VARVIEAPAPQRPFSLPRIAAEVGEELTRREPLPPGFSGFSLSRTRAFQRDTLALLLDGYRRFGPVFTLRVFHRPVVVMLGPDANHFLTVAGTENFSWRAGMAGEQLTPLLGDGLITTDGEYHDRARRIMMPAFHSRRIHSAVAVIEDATRRSIERWRPGDRVDVYAWARELAMAIAMRALAGLDPYDAGRGRAATGQFERALAFFDQPPWLMLMRGPGTPWARMQAARRELDVLLQLEIERRRRAGAAAEPEGDVLSMLMAARDEDGGALTDGELRDQLTTLLFGGHDTTASATSLLLYELARHPDVLDRVLASPEPELELALDETLRLYPPVWLGARLAVGPFEFGGHRIPAGTHVIYSPWASHRLPDVFAEPDRFLPERFAPGRRVQLPKGAYVPFGGGQRICIGKRFGSLVARTVASVTLSQVRLKPAPGHVLSLAPQGTLTPRGLPLLVAGG
jgi:cytochrome P450